MTDRVHLESAEGVVPGHGRPYSIIDRTPAAAQRRAAIALADRRLRLDLALVNRLFAAAQDDAEQAFRGAVCAYAAAAAGLCDDDAGDGDAIQERNAFERLSAARGIFRQDRGRRPDYRAAYATHAAAVAAAGAIHAAAVAGARQGPPAGKDELGMSNTAEPDHGPQRAAPGLMGSP